MVKSSCNEIHLSESSKKIWNNVIIFIQFLDDNDKTSISSFFVGTNTICECTNGCSILGYKMNFYTNTLDTIDKSLTVECIEKARTHIDKLIGMEYIHGDIKFSNVLMNDDVDSVVLTDFDGVYNIKGNNKDCIFITPLYVNFAYLNHRLNKDGRIDIDKLMNLVFTPYASDKAELYKTQVKTIIKVIIGDTELNNYFNYNKENLIKYSDLYSLGMCCIMNDNEDIKALGFDYLSEALPIPPQEGKGKGKDIQRGGSLKVIPVLSEDLKQFINDNKNKKMELTLETLKDK